MKFMQALKGKLLVGVIASLVLVGGATAVFASSPARQSTTHTTTHSQSTTTTTHQQAGHKNESHTKDTGNHATSCPGLPTAKELAAEFALSTDETGNAVQAICALHEGTFQGTTPSNASVTSSRVFGFGEIEMLLTYAQFLADHDKANAGGKLTSSNVPTYLAQALQSCGTTSLETCLTANIPGSGHSNNTGNTSDQHSNHGHDNGNGKPTVTPTPHH